jgi:thiamine-phosphate diphosphorylase
MQMHITKNETNNPFFFFVEKHCRTRNAHGTGCTLASAIAAQLARGAEVPTAINAARRFTWRALERSAGIPLGAGPQRPMNHAYRTCDWRAELERTLASDASGTETTMTTATTTATSAEEGGATREESRHDATAAAAAADVASSVLPPRRPNPIDVRVYAVTDAEMIAASGRSLSEAVLLAVDGGATVVQLREKTCDSGEFARRAATALVACRRAGVPLIINDRADVAFAVGADGIHVGQDDLPVAAVRKLLGPDAILGVSVKTVEQARRAQAQGADYVGVGAMYPTSTKTESSVVGLEDLREIVDAVDIPVVAIGGVDKENARHCLEAGADGVAVVSAIFKTSEGGPGDAARELRRVVDACLQEHRKPHHLSS